jgi:uncharacterized membrane-anchored protein
MKRALLAIGVLWLAIIGGIVGIKECTLRTGQEILLKTVPVDPRDLFRGDYVILSYEISSLDVEKLGTAGAVFSRGQEVYVLLGTDGHYSVATGVRPSRPSRQELFLKGHVRAVAGSTVQVEYGIESYFVPEGQGRVLEQARGKHLDVKASVDTHGRAGIKALFLDGKEVRFI